MHEFQHIVGCPHIHIGTCCRQQTQTRARGSRVSERPPCLKLRKEWPLICCFQCPNPLSTEAWATARSTAPEVGSSVLSAQPTVQTCPPGWPLRPQASTVKTWSGLLPLGITVQVQLTFPPFRRLFGSGSSGFPFLTLGLSHTFRIILQFFPLHVYIWDGKESLFPLLK